MIHSILFKSVIAFCFLQLFISSVISQNIKISAGPDINLTCLDKVKLNTKLINWTSCYNDNVGFRAFHFPTDSVGYATGGMWSKGVVAKTTDRGQTWFSVECPATSFLYDIYFINNDTGFVVGGNWGYNQQIILMTVDGGNTWIQKSSQLPYALKAICFLNDTVGFAAGKTSGVVKTNDGGKTWNNITAPYGDFEDILLINDSILLLLDNRGSISKTLVDSINWETIEFDFAFPLYSMAQNRDRIFITAAEGIILYSDDLFETYEVTTTGVLSALYDITFISVDTGLISGGHGTILTTVDGGQSWNREYCDYEGHLYGIYALDASTRFVAGSMPSLLNNGSIMCYSVIPEPLSYTWEPSDGLSDPFAPDPLLIPTSSGVYLVTVADTTGIIASDEIHITVWEPYIHAGNDHSIDPNDTVQLHGVVQYGRWEIDPPASSVWFNNVQFLNRDTGFIVGSQLAGSIIKTTDGGKTWHHKIFNINYRLDDLHFINDSVGIVVGYKGTILRTTDCGENWVRIQSHTTKGLNSVHFVNENVGYIGGDNKYMIKTTDGGLTWSHLHLFSWEDLLKVYFINENHGFATAVFHLQAAFFETRDGGLNWKKNCYSRFDNILYRYSFCK
jgi:photosystem II stability/assembly factor-like uncharacterized protein